MATDLPMFSSSAYASNTMMLNQVDTPVAAGNENLRRVLAAAIPAVQKSIVPTTSKQEGVMAVTRRFIQVIVADSNENVPLESCVLYKGEPKVTDLTDQELYFELDIKELLAKHNEKRITFKDKAVKERVELLEPAKVRDLKMVVVTIASL